MLPRLYLDVRTERINKVSVQEHSAKFLPTSTFKHLHFGSYCTKHIFIFTIRHTHSMVKVEALKGSSVSKCPFSLASVTLILNKHKNYKSAVIQHRPTTNMTMSTFSDPTLYNSIYLYPSPILFTLCTQYVALARTHAYRETCPY